MDLWLRRCFFASCVALAGCSSMKDLQKKAFQVDRMWTRPALLEPAKEHRLSHRMTPLLVADNDLVIQGNGNDGLRAFSQSTGQTRWSYPVEGGLEGGVQAFKNSLYFGANDGNFYSLTFAGELQWKFSVNSQVFSVPLIRDETIYFLSGNNTLFALDLQGKEKWRYRRPTANMLSVRGAPRPYLERGVLYLGMTDGYFVAVDASDGQLLWERQLIKNVRFTDIDATPVITQGRIYVASYDGTLFCLDQKRGQVIWRIDQGSHTAVTIVGDRLYYATSDGEVLAVEKDSGKQIWSYRVPKGIATRPKVYKGVLVFGESEGPLRFLSSRDGSSISSFDPGRGISASPNVSRKTGEVFFVSNEGLLYALKIGWREQSHDWPWLN